MKMKNRFWNGLTVLAVLASLSLLSCDLFAPDPEPTPEVATFSVTGKLVNVREVAQSNLPALGSVEIRKFGATTAVKTVAVSNGTFELTEVPRGEYILTFKGDGWAGIPVSVTVLNSKVEGVGALVYVAPPAGTILLVTTWTNKAYDIDSHSVVGLIPADGSLGPVHVGYDRDGSGADESNYTLGYTAGVPGAVGSNAAVVALERDVSDLMIATNGDYPAETTLVTSLPYDTELRFYVHCATTTGNLSGLDAGADSIQPAGVTVYVMYQDILTNTPTHFGTWYSPLNTAEAVIGMVSLYRNSQFLADGVTADGSTAIGSFGLDFSTGGSTMRSLSPVIKSGVLVKEIK